MSKHQKNKDDFIEELVDEELEVIHKRTKVINHDNNIDLILAGRAAKHSVEVPDELKENNQRMQKIIIESENDFTHLMGEVTGEKYDICGRPELTLINVGYTDPPTLLPKKLSIFKYEDEEDESVDTKDDKPNGIQDIRVLYHSAKTFFLLSPRAEDQLLALFKDYPSYEIVVKGAETRFGSYEFFVLDNKLRRLWRRFQREYLFPLLLNQDRLELMEGRLNFEVPYTDDAAAPESDPNTSEEEEEVKVKKKRGKKKKGGAGGGAAAVTGGGPAANPSKKKTEIATSNSVSKREASVPTTSARITQRMSTKKGVGLLAKRTTSVKADNVK